MSLKFISEGQVGCGVYLGGREWGARIESFKIEKATTKNYACSHFLIQTKSIFTGKLTCTHCCWAHANAMAITWREAITMVWMFVSIWKSQQNSLPATTVLRGGIFRRQLDHWGPIRCSWIRLWLHNRAKGGKFLLLPFSHSIWPHQAFDSRVPSWSTKKPPQTPNVLAPWS